MPRPRKVPTPRKWRRFADQRPRARRADEATPHLRAVLKVLAAVGLLGLTAAMVVDSTRAADPDQFAWLEDRLASPTDASSSSIQAGFRSSARP